MAFSDVTYYIFLVFGASSLILHILVLFVIVLSPARRLFKGEFWQLYAINSLYTVLMSLMYDVVYRCRQNPMVAHIVLTYLPSEGFVPTLFVSLFNIASIVTIFTYLLINFNRFTVLYLKQKHNMFWNRCYIWFLALIFVMQIVIGSNAFFLDVRITRPEVLEFYKWDGTRKLSYFKMSTINFCGAVLSTVVSVVLNTYIVYSLVWNRKKLLNEFKIKHSDIRLCLFSSVMFISYSGLAFSQVAFVFGAGSEMSFQQVMTYQSYFMDLSHYMPPWALLGTSTLLRRATFSLLRCSLGRNATTLNSTVVKSQTAFRENISQKPRQ